MTNNIIFKMAIEAKSEESFILSVVGTAEEYDAENWDETNGKMRKLYKMCNLSMKQIRNYTGLTQKAFAESINASRRTIEDWESGRRSPAPHVKYLILQYFNMLK